MYKPVAVIADCDCDARDSIRSDNWEIRITCDAGLSVLKSNTFPEFGLS